MGMSGGSSSGGAVPNINVTPLIDVLLVLLIIFMIIAPSKPSRFKAQVPAEPKEDDKTIAKPNPLTLVVSISGVEKKVTLNNEDAGTTSNAELLTNRLNEIFKDRAQNGVLRDGTNELEKTVFIKAPKSIPYGEVVKVIDAVKTAQADPIGLQIDDLAN